MKIHKFLEISIKCWVIHFDIDVKSKCFHLIVVHFTDYNFNLLDGVLIEEVLFKQIYYLIEVNVLQL